VDAEVDGEGCGVSLNAVDAAAVAGRVAEMRERIARAGGRDVALVAVTKTFGPAAITAALAAGCEGIGENKAQELIAKVKLLDQAPPVHFIGRLQSNKVRSLAPWVAVWESVDRSSIAEEIAARAAGATVLVQVNATGESDKGGVPAIDVEPLVDRCRELGLHVAGLMTVGPTEGGAEAARPAFRTVRALCDQLELGVCSMGMTGDLEVAVEEGTTEVRVGTALFGPRPAR
jgi:pyridoxal phosphate enzyme (YggS family)